MGSVGAMRTLLIAAACVTLAAGCGPASPNRSQSAAADPTGLLKVLPAPEGLTNARPQHAADAMEVLQEVLERPPSRAEANKATGSGLGASAIRTFRTAGGGHMSATVMVWPSDELAQNFALQLVQRRLGTGGRTAWTPSQIPGSQGARQPTPPHERILVRAVGRNALVVRATGDVSDDAVQRTLGRLVTVQDARG